MDDIDALGWRDFERLVMRLLEAKGYTCRYVGGKRDHGADIVARKDGESLAVQVKHRRDGQRWIGETAVRATTTAAPVYKCDRGIVVTNSTFAPGVRTVARANHVALRDREWLAKELASFCVLCGARVSPKVRDWCGSRPELYRGNTYCFEHQRRPAFGVLRIAESVRDTTL